MYQVIKKKTRGDRNKPHDKGAKTPHNKSFSIEIDGNNKNWISCRSLEECEIKLAEILK